MDYFTDQQVRTLVRRLWELTKAGKATWVAAENDYEFALRTPTTTYRLLSRDSDDYAPYRLIILRRGEDRQFTVLQTVISSDLEDSTSEEDFYNLYKFVKRSVLGLDAVADDVLRELEELDTQDPPSPF